jgi:hypothetical protein
MNRAFDYGLHSLGTREMPSRRQAELPDASMLAAARAALVDQTGWREPHLFGFGTQANQSHALDGAVETLAFVHPVLTPCTPGT